ncbi:DMT family transporter [Adlercreutzia sp. ZJ473]|uniref:DMT family transporter n=1 Tax=Adlercreutzia sp. ZJ473 TaxID=2722822 RepID=UPI001552E6AE|nr:DMT family transporter [Adlercreutzia sp. ZJ473]
MRPSPLASALLVFAGGACYGAMAPVIRVEYAAGFTWQQTTAGQATFGALLFAALLAVQLARGRRLAPVSASGALKLVGMGMTTCCTCIFYSISLAYLPVAAAITLLFQFTWIGLVIQMLVTRTPPRAAELAAAALVVAGTLLASGLLSSELEVDYHPVGVACGLVSAVSCALFMFFSSRVETEMPPVQRGLIVCAGAALLANAVCPTFIPGGTMAAIAPYGLVQGLFALFLPVILFGLGTPQLPCGISTILASAELPCSIILTFLVVGEGVDALQAAGVATILAGVVVSQLPALAAIMAASSSQRQ